MKTKIDAVVARLVNHFDGLNDANEDIDQLAKTVACSKYHLIRCFKQQTGYTIHQFSRLIRLKHAAFLLYFKPEMTILDISLKCQFSSHEGLLKAFKSFTGMTPSDFRTKPNWQPICQFLSSYTVGFETCLQEVELRHIDEFNIVGLAKKCGEFDGFTVLKTFFEHKKRFGVQDGSFYVINTASHNGYHPTLPPKLTRNKIVAFKASKISNFSTSPLDIYSVPAGNYLCMTFKGDTNGHIEDLYYYIFQYLAQHNITWNQSPLIHYFSQPFFEATPSVLTCSIMVPLAPSL